MRIILRGNNLSLFRERLAPWCKISGYTDTVKYSAAMVTYMARGSQRHDPESYKAKLDRGLAAVMPGDWVGHARIKINEADLSDKQAEFARRLSDRLLGEKDDVDAETIGDISIEKAKEKV